MDILSYKLGKQAGGGITPTGTIEITSNGETNVANYATADVNVQPDLQSKSISITENGSTTVSPDQDKDGLSEVSITTNVQPDLESKSITISTNTTTTITPTYGYDGLSSVEVTTNIPSQKFAFKSPCGFNFSGVTKTTIATEIANITQNVDTSKITIYTRGFSRCTSLYSLDLSAWDLTDYIDMVEAFYGDSNLNNINLSNIGIVKTLTSCFQGCTSLQRIDLRNATLNQMTQSSKYSNAFYNVPANCLIIVKDSTQKQWINTNFSNLTNVKTPEEL